MSDPSLPLQAAIVSTLKAASSVTAIVSQRIYDQLPSNTIPDFPYVTLGPMQVLPDKAQCIDGSEVTIQIDVWSRTKGFKQAKDAAAAIDAALDDQDITVEGYTAVIFEIANISHQTDPDGITKHSVLTFRTLIESQA